MSVSRRQFLRTTAAAGGSVLALQWNARAAGSDGLRVGLSGCGARGAGAVSNALHADPGVRRVALADAFADRLQATSKLLKDRHPDQVDVAPARCFAGLEAYGSTRAGCTRR